MKPAPLALAAALSLAACSPADDPLHTVTRMAPREVHDCIAPRLDALPVRHSTEPTPGGWRISLHAYATPPAGWYDKGRLEFVNGTVTYLPQTATQDIGDARIRAGLRPILRDCAGRQRRQR